MRKTQLIRGGVVALIMALLPLPGFAQTLERIQAAGTINIGFVPDQAPFSQSAAGGQAVGYTVELCNRAVDVAKAKIGVADLTVKYRSTAVEAGLELVARGEIDMLCGAVTDTLARREQVAFSVPVYNGGIGALLRTDAAADLTRVLSGEVAHEGPRWRSTVRQGLANHTYAVHDETTGEDWVRAQVATLGVTATVVTVTEHEQGVDMVASRGADAYFADRAILQRYATQNEAANELTVLERYFDFEPLAIAVPRGDDDFRLVVDTALSELYRSDDFAPLFTRHFGAPGALTLTLFEAYARP